MIKGWVQSNSLRQNDGKIAIGVTTNPELFLNLPMMAHPFNGDGVRHAIWRTSEYLLEAKYGKTKEHSLIGGEITTGLLINVWIEGGKLKMCKDSTQKMCEIDLLYDESGNMLDYYFAMAFTTTPKMIFKFKISGDFV